MKKVLNIFALGLLLLGCMSCGCTKKRVLPDVDPATFDRYSQDLRFTSKILGTEIKYSLYLPKSYVSEKEKRYPVVYMCHGYGNDNNSWDDSISSIDIAENNGSGEMIYVYPQAFNSYYCNRYDGSYNYMDMFVSELIPHIDATLRTIPDREHRFITGYSMGGFGAMVMAMKHPGLFSASAPLSMSFRTDEMYMSESKDGWNSQWGSIFGGYGTTGPSRITEYYKAHCPLYQFNAQNHAALDLVHWLLSCGDDEERLLIANDTLHVIMRDNGYEHEFRVSDGAHTSSYWRSALLEVIPMFWFYANGGAKWPGIAMETPVENKGDFADDGSLASDAYTTDGTGTAIYIFHDGMDGELLKKAILVMHRNQAGSKYILLPCDLSQKSVEEWISYWPNASIKKIAVAFKEAGRGVFAKKSNFAKCVLINASVAIDPTTIKLDSKDNMAFVCTDKFPWYRDMDILYHACKTQNTSYQYRVIKSSDEEENDLLRCVDIAKAFITN